MTLLSFPRDLEVPIWCRGHQYLPDRINSAYALGGPKCTIETVKALTGLRINYLVTVNFVGFTQVVDKLGGIWIDVDRRYFHENTGGYDQYAAINLEPGYQKVYGRNALQFVRYRHTDNDLIRNARQQLFVRAVKDKITHDFHADTIPKVIGALRKNIEVAAGGGKAARPQDGHQLRAGRLRAAVGQRRPREAGQRDAAPASRAIRWSRRSRASTTRWTSSSTRTRRRR